MRRRQRVREGEQKDRRGGKKNSFKSHDKEIKRGSERAQPRVHVLDHESSTSLCRVSFRVCASVSVTSRRTKLRRKESKIKDFRGLFSFLIPDCNRGQSIRHQPHSLYQ